MVRVCHVCKSEAEFTAKGKMCRECNRKYQQRHYQANKEKYKLRSKDHRKKLASMVRERKAAQPCADCGKNYPPIAMDFHHLGDKEDDIASLVNAQVSFSRMEAEMAKCVVLCAVCHRLRHAGLV